MHTPETCAALDCARTAGPFHTTVPGDRLVFARRRPRVPFLTPVYVLILARDWRGESDR